MRRILKKYIRNLLNHYKPIDSKLRRHAYYRRISIAGQWLYHYLGLGARPVERFYIENYRSIPVEDDVILFESFWGRKLACNPYAIYRELRRQHDGKKHRCIWVKNRNISPPADIAGDPDVTFVEFDTVEYARALLRAKYLVSNMTFRPYFIRKEEQIYMNTWHGIPIKTLGMDAHSMLKDSFNTQRNFRQATHIVMAGTYATEKTVVPYGASTDVLPKVRNLGSPRIDLTLSANRAKIRASLGVLGDENIALFAPTWRGNVRNVSTDMQCQLDAIKVIQENLGSEFRLFVSLHNFVRHKMKILPGDCVHVPDHVETNELLSVVDIMITDYSSIAVDYLVVDKPLVLFVPDKIKYQMERGLYINLEELPVMIADDFEGLSIAVKTKRKPSDFSGYRDIVEKLIPNEDGKAAERALTYLFSSPDTVTVTDKIRKRIIIHPGSLLNNGITSSVLNLLRNIDYNRYDVSVVVESLTIDRDKVRRERFSHIDSRCQIILRGPRLNLTAIERQAYASVRTDRNADEGHIQTVINAFNREARRVLGDHHYDVAIDFSGYSPFWSLFMLGVKADRSVIYLHNDMRAEASNPERNFSQLEIEFRLYKYFDKVVSVSDGLERINRENFAKHFKSVDASVSVRNPITPMYLLSRASDPLALVSTLGHALCSSMNVVKFINIARLSPEKNQVRLLRAFAKVVSNDINAVLFIVGGGSLRTVLEKEASRLRISDRVIFTGILPNPYPLLAACDCFVLSSDYEGQGIVLLEAMTLGTPCIATDNPAVRSVLGGGHGLIVDANPQSLSEAMIEFCRVRYSGPTYDANAYATESMMEFYTRVCGEGSENMTISSTIPSLVNTRTIAQNSPPA